MLDVQQIDDFSKAVVALKNHQWINHQERDLIPSIFFGLRDRDELIVVPDSVMRKLVSDSGSNIVKVVETMVSTVDDIPFDFERLEIAGSITEALMKAFPLDTPKVEYDRGDFAKEVAVDPASLVERCVVLTLATSDLVGGCDVQTSIMGYKVGDGGVIEWNEPMLDAGGKGLLCEAFKGFFVKEKS
ncbi:hypothetical protein [Ilumatobacter sp.]|uniref:hypothetical protein n=1 Tax=Ilumatobacter sp. TaxID=1967498 RepID=UPI003750FAD1